MNDANEYLKQMDAEFAKGQAEPDAKREFPEVPDGVYKAMITDVAYRLTKETQKPYILWCLKIQNGELAGRYIFRKSFINPKSVMYLGQDFARVGIETRFADLATETGKAAMLTAVGVVVEVTQKTTKNGDKTFVNHYIKFVERSTYNPSEVAAPSKNEDEVPF